MQDMQFSPIPPIPDHVEAQYSRYWRDGADAWRRMEMEIRSRGRTLQSAEYTCHMQNDQERLLLVMLRTAHQNYVIEQLDGDIPWSRRKAILEEEIGDPITTEKYYARNWWEVQGASRKAAAGKITEGGIPPGAIFAGLFLLLILIMAFKGC